jgi:pilus assembly protein CpaD
MIMASIKSPAALLVLGIAVTACGPMQNGLLGTAQNRTLYSVHQPVVQRTDYVFDLAAGGGGIPGSELDRLAGWFDSLGLRFGDHISVDAPYNASGYREDVAHVAASYGLLVTEDAPVTAGAVQPGSVRVVVSRAAANVPGCPDWRYARYLGEPISTQSNFGCAQNTNLAAMIADPNHLIGGQADIPGGDAATAAKAIKLYRDTAPTGTKGLDSTSTKGGQ